MKYFLTSLIIFLFFSAAVFANGLPDRDQDGVPDQDEINIYHTNPDNPDTDGDGFNDWVELNSGYSPYEAGQKKLENSDFDKDGVSDKLEIKFGTDPTNPDTDGDGILDGDEIKNGFDPLDATNKNKVKRIEIDLINQKLNYFQAKVLINSFKISTGKRSMPTPKGNYTIGNKSPKAWSKTYGLWMPYWLGLSGQKFGIHELPYWPNGYREGENHLGTPVSHGCIRLGIGPAKTLYDWAEVGTPVIIN